MNFILDAIRILALLVLVLVHFHFLNWFGANNGITEHKRISMDPMCIKIEVYNNT